MKGWMTGGREGEERETGAGNERAGKAVIYVGDKANRNYRGRHRYGRDQARSEAQRQDQTWWLKGRQEGGGERRGTLLPHGVRYEW